MRRWGPEGHGARVGPAGRPVVAAAIIPPSGRRRQAGKESGLQHGPGAEAQARC